MHSEALDHFITMKDSAAISSIDLTVCSAYRSYDDQKIFVDKYKDRAETPGYSEHHLGTAIDINGVYWNSKAYDWLIRNAHYYGFVLTHYRGHRIVGAPEEPNQWRYIGLKQVEAYYNKHKDNYFKNN